MECNYMSFFKLLSDKPEDFEQTEHEPADSYDIETDDMQDFLQLTLDTGEVFSVPLEWLLCACRENKFSLEHGHHYSVAKESIH